MKLSKCTFNAKQINFLDYQIGQFRISIVKTKTDSIVTWPMSQTHCKVQQFFRFANFYCRFIQNYSRVPSGLSDLLVGGVKENIKSIPFVMTNKALKAFSTLKRLFASVFMLVHYDLTRWIMLECDASRFAIGAILSQLVSQTG